MTPGDLLVTLKWGPFSSVLPVHATSIIRAVPVASQGLEKVPSPVEPLGQSTGGAALAVAAGAGGTSEEAAEADVGGADPVAALLEALLAAPLASGAPDGFCSF